MSTIRGAWETTVLCAHHALSRKACDVSVLEVAALTSVADYFLICSGRSTTQVQAIARCVEENLKHEGIRCLAIEGYSTGHWILLDFADVVVHIFYSPVRVFYDLERLWSRAGRPELPEPYRSQARSLKTGTEGL